MKEDNKDILLLVKEKLTTNADYLFLSIIISIPLYIGITGYPIFQWDEARSAINTYEMLQNNNFIVTHFNGAPDMWSTKPPLLIWFQVFFSNIFGINELSLRLPSLLAAFFTCVLLYNFLVNKMKAGKSLAFFTVICLIGCQGYMSTHVVRTGDYDALLTFFTTVYTLYFFLYTKDGKTRDLIYFITGITAAVLTKGIAGLLMTPGLLMYAIISGNYFKIISRKSFWIGISVFLFSIFSYYLLREIMNPGYLKAVFNNELKGRYLEVNEGHSESFFFYFKLLKNEAFGLILCLFAILNIYYSIIEKKSPLSVYGQYVWISAISFLLVLSFSQTKLEWYAAPSFPLIASSAVLGIFNSFAIIRKKINLISIRYLILISSLLVFPNYIKTLDISIHSKKIVYSEWKYNTLNYMKNVLNYTLPYEPEYHILIKDSYGAPYEYYQRLLKDQGMEMRTYNLLTPQGEPKYLIVGDPLLLDEISRIYKVSVLKKIENISFVRINTIEAADELKEYNINAYAFNEYGVKVVPHLSDLHKVIVVVKNSAFDKSAPVSYHYVDKVDDKEQYHVKDIGMWIGKDADSISYTVMNHYGIFQRVAIGQQLANGKSWEQWFGR